MTTPAPLDQPPAALQRLDHWLDLREQAMRWRGVMALIVGLAGTLGGLFWYFTPTLIHHPPQRLDDFAALCTNPGSRDLVEPFLAYRILTPAVAWLLGLRGTSGVALQYGGLVVLLALSFVLFRREHGRLAGLSAVVAVTGTFAFIWSAGYPGFPDSVTHALVVAALCWRHPAAITGLLALALLNDERAILGAPCVVLWHLYPAGNLSRRSVLALVACVAAATLLYLLLYVALTRGLIGPGISRPSIYGRILASMINRGQPWDSSWPKFAWNVFMGFRWLWLLPLLALLHRGTAAQRRLLQADALLLLGGSLATAIVADVSRSIGFLLPGLLLALRHLLHTPGISRWRWGATLLILQLVTPVFYHVGDWSGHCRPYPVELVRLVTGVDPVDVVLQR